MSLNMKIIVSVDVQESGVACSFARFWLISESFFDGVWTRNVFALNDFPCA